MCKQLENLGLMDWKIRSEFLILNGLKLW
jgi:hypothetical protein